jgi:polynucleotide 5'-kinase involved in rRNA processing
MYMNTLPIDCSAKLIIERIAAFDRRILLFGESGIGKSTLAVEMARALDGADRRCLCIGADPGSPAFGVPGAVCLGIWRNNSWRPLDFEALCSLDAGRFPLPM